ncbi:MAG: LysR family transcriptional regulator [Methyloligellaceae bacterium]
MDSEALRTFLVIYHNRSFSVAATRLGRSQPAISRRIALLEEELGVPLFERTSNGIVLSQAGQVLLPYAQRVLASINDCCSAIEGLRSGNAGPLAIAAVGTLASTNMTTVLKQFSSMHSEVTLTIRTATSSEISELVRNGEATIGLRYFTDHASDLHNIEISKEHLHIACSPDHPLAGKTVKSLRSLASEHWLAFPYTHKVRESSADNIFAQFLTLGISDLHWTPVDSLTAQKRLIEAGYGIAMLPDSSTIEEQAANSLKIIKVKGFDIYNPVCLVTRREGYLSPAATKLIELFRSKYGGI